MWWKSRKSEPCPTCGELRRQVVYLQGLVDRALMFSNPVAVPEPPDVVEDELPENVSERIKFGEG